jgi:type II secretory pathway pseudopilin PulG
MLARRISELREEQGFGLIELTFALAVLNIALLALIGAFLTGATSLRRAGKVSAAGAVANQQMELYRAMTYCQIALTGDSAGALTTTPASPYQTDVAYSSTQVTTARSNTWCAAQSPAKNPPYNACLSTLGTKPSPALSSCSPSQTVTGADGRKYRVDTYIVLATGGSASTFSGREVKQVTAVVRDGRDLKELARQVSTFDPLTGS